MQAHILAGRCVCAHTQSCIRTEADVHQEIFFGQCKLIGIVFMCMYVCEHLSVFKVILRVWVHCCTVSSLFFSSPTQQQLWPTPPLLD